ncbi:hypothetical protein Tco_0585515 [Tanacetum coccineum]
MHKHAVIKCKTAKAIWNDLILAHEGPSDTKDAKIDALRLKFNAFKALEGEKVNGTFTRLKCLLNDLENNGVIIPQAEVNATTVTQMLKKYLRSSSEFIADLNAEYHERALLENQKRFYKRSRRGTTKIKVFMVMAKEEPSVGKADARSVIRVNLENKSLKDEISDLKREEEVREKRISSKEVIFTKADESSSMLIPDITSDPESKCETQEPFPPLPKLIGDAPTGISNSIISLTDLTLNMADLTLNTSVPKRTKPTSNKVSPTYVIEKKTKTKAPVVLVPQPEKKADLSVEKLLLTLMDELKCSTCGSIDHLTKEYLEETAVNKTLTKLKAQSSLNPSAKKAPMIPKTFKECKYCGFNNHHSDKCEYYPGCKVCGSVAHETADYPKKYPNSRKPKIANKRLTEPTEKVAYVNGLKHNLINISQLCDANFKVLFTKTQGTIFNQNDEVVLIASRKRDFYVIDMLSYNEESNACFFAKASPSMENLNEVKVKELRSGNETKFRNHKLEEFYDEKVAKDFRVFNIRRQEIKETYHVSLNEDDEEISQSSTEGDAINFNENRFFPNDEFLEPRNKVTQCSENIEYFPYIPAYETIPKNISPTYSPILQDYVSPKEPPEFTSADDHPVLNEHGHPELVDDLEPAEIQDNAINEPINGVQPSPTTISPSIVDETNPSIDGISHPPVPQDKWSKEKRIELVNIISEP